MIPSTNPFDHPTNERPSVQSIDENININQQGQQLLSENLNELNKKEKCIVTLKTTDGLTIKADKCVLSLNSAFFERMFMPGTLESGQNIIYLKYMTNSILKQLIHFIYTGTMVTLDDENVEEMLNASELLKLEDVKVKCVEFLINGVNDINCLVFKEIGDARMINILSFICFNHALMNFDSVSRFEGFLNLKVKKLIELIKRDDLQTENEENVYRAIINWIIYDERKRKRFLPKLISFIRLPSTLALYRKMKKERLIRQNPNCMRILNKAYKYFNSDEMNIIPTRQTRNILREVNYIGIYLQEMYMLNISVHNIVSW